MCPATITMGALQSCRLRVQPAGLSDRPPGQEKLIAQQPKPAGEHRQIAHSSSSSEAQGDSARGLPGTSGTTCCLHPPMTDSHTRRIRSRGPVDSTALLRASRRLSGQIGPAALVASGAGLLVERRCVRWSRSDTQGGRRPWQLARGAGARAGSARGKNTLALSCLARSSPDRVP
jgi:hypothetical protein